MKSDLQILQEARAYLDNRDHWIEGGLRSGDGYCLVGVIGKFSGYGHSNKAVYKNRLVANLGGVAKRHWQKFPINDFWAILNKDGNTDIYDVVWLINDELGYEKALELLDLAIQEVIEASLPGKSKTVTVEPLKVPTSPEPAPEPQKVPEKEKVGARGIATDISHIQE